MPTAKTEKRRTKIKKKKKKATPKAHQWVVGGPHPRQPGYRHSALPRIKTPASPGTDLGFRVTLAVHKLIPAESAFAELNEKPDLGPTPGLREAQMEQGWLPSRQQTMKLGGLFLTAPQDQVAFP